MSLEPISKATEIAKSTVYGWLLRLEGDLDRRHDRKSPGRPCRLSEEQRHDPQLRIGPSMPIILQMCAPKHATFV